MPTEATDKMPLQADLIKTIAHHDAAISTLSGQMKTLQGEVHHGFSAINATLGTINMKMEGIFARPSFDFHKTVSTVVAIAVLFSMIVGGIIWVTQSQFAGSLAKQDSQNATVNTLLDRFDRRIQSNEDRVTRVEQSIGRWATTTITGKGAR